MPKSNPFNPPQWVQSGCRVLVVGYYGYGNFGDEWLRLIAIRWLTQQGIGSIACLWPTTAYIDGIQYVNRWSIGAIIRLIWACDGIVYAGGSVFQDRTSRRSVWYYAAILYLAKWLNRPVWLWGHGLGSLKLSSRWLLTQVAPRQLMVDCRDAESYQLAMQVWPNAACVHSHDLSILDKSQVPIRPDTLMPMVLGLSVRTGYPPAVLTWCQNQGKLKVLQTQEPLKFESDSVHNLNTYLRNNNYHTETILDWVSIREDLANVQGIVSMRYHVLVVAHQLGIRCMGVSADPKIQSFCMEHGYPWVSDIDVSCAKLEAAWRTQ
ncbi:hypothetical protein CL648_02210 [bacterium]|nr:hypothetical protein [bacterium]